MRGRGGSTRNSRGGSPVSTQRQNFRLRRDQEVLVEAVGRNGHLHPLAAAGDDREHRLPGIDDPHVVLQLRHVLLGGRLLGERPGQHELGLEHRPGAVDHPVEGRAHPAVDRVAHLPLHLRDHLAGIALIPVPIEVLGHAPELDDQIARQVLRLDLAALLAPEPQHFKTHRHWTLIGWSRYQPCESYTQFVVKVPILSNY